VRFALVALVPELTLSPEAVAQGVAELSVQPVQVRLNVGETYELVASAMDRSGQLIANARYAWKSSDLSVVRVEEDPSFVGLGVVTAVGPGLAMLEVRSGNLMTSLPVLVVGARVVVQRRAAELAPQPRPASADTILSDRVPDLARRVVLKLRAHPFGSQPRCFSGVVVGRSGLVLTTYGAIRGADRLDGFRGRRMLRAIDIAAYDGKSNLAVLRVRGIPDRDSLVIADNVADDQVVWAFGYPDCGVIQSGRFSLTRNPERPDLVVQLSRPLRGSTAGAPFLTSDGRIAAVAARARTAVLAARAADLIDEARRAVEQDALMLPAQVGRRENHAYGLLRISSGFAGSVVRVFPLENWHLPSDGRASATPFRFKGPMGRYKVELVVDGVVTETLTVEIVPGEVTNVRLEG
jgi:hypothetical protein